MQVALQRWKAPGESFELLEWNDAGFSVLERDRVAGVALVGDAVEPDDVAEHVITGDLFPPVLGHHRRLAGADPHGVERRERLAGTIDRCAALETSPFRHHAVELL